MLHEVNGALTCVGDSSESLNSRRAQGGISSEGVEIRKQKRGNVAFSKGRKIAIRQRRETEKTKKEEPVGAP